MLLKKTRTVNDLIYLNICLKVINHTLPKDFNVIFPYFP